MNDYRAYGLNIRSSLPMPELWPNSAGAGRADVIVRYGELVPPGPEEMETFFFVRSDEDGIYYFVQGHGGVLARGGREVVADPIDGPWASGFHHLVSGIGLGLALHQRGALTLHASAVAVDGGVVAFVGWKGMGKSTTAAAFYRRGHRIVTDDLLVLDVTGEGVAVLPGFPSLKLWPEAALALGDDPEALPRLHPEGEKRARTTPTAFDPAPLPLRAVYALDYAEAGEGFGVEALSPREACVELMRHTFALRILGDAGANPAHLRQCAHVARHVPVRRLRRERRLSGIHEVVERVEEDLARHVAPAAAAGMPPPAGPLPAGTPARADAA